MCKDNYARRHSLFQIRKCQLNAEDTRNLLMCFTWVLKNVDKSVLRQWWTDMPINRLNCILEIIYFAISNFEYRVFIIIYFTQESSYLLSEQIYILLVF